MPPVGTTLEELAEASETPPERLIEFVLERITDDDDRHEFLQGLSVRLVALRGDDPGGQATDELHRWVGAWMISLDLLDDEQFLAADDEASKLVSAGKLGKGMTAGEIRSRYRP